MFKFSPVLLVVVVVCAALGLGDVNTATTATTVATERRVMGGAAAAEGQFPFAVSIFMASTTAHQCGGSIISTLLILSAGHCFVDRDNELWSARNFAVQAGTVSRSSEATTTTAQIRRIQQIRVHPGFLQRRPHYDLAVLRLRNALTLIADRVAVAPLPTRADYGTADGRVTGHECTVIGWGLTENDVRPKRLQFATVLLIARKMCERLWQRPIEEDMLCAMGGVGQDAAVGDSGGPLVCDGRVTGVVSYGPKGEQQGQAPGVYANVGNSLEWIRHGEFDLHSAQEAQSGGNRWWLAVSVVLVVLGGVALP